MKLEGYIGKWGTCNFDKDSVHSEDVEKLDNYPFKEEWHKCIGVDLDYLVVEFSCINLRLRPFAFVEVEAPDFMPFDNVKYISSKGKLEIGCVISFSTLRKPHLHKVYILNVKGKVKSTLYERERLILIEDTPTVLKRREDLSKTISHALRHEPDKYDINLDLQGWVEMNKLIEALKKKSSEWQSLRYYDILKMIDQSEKKRHEVKAHRIGPEYKNVYEWFIRAKYGHSVKGSIYQERTKPPKILYHGTTSKAAELILKEGLKPMDRQYVHLSQKLEEAVRVGKRRQDSPRIFKVNASQAFKDNVNFYKGNDRIWLSDIIEPKYLELLES